MFPRTGLAATAILLSVALAGCTALSTGETTQAPTPEPSSSATVAPQGDPQPILPLTCAELLTEAEASSILQYDVTLTVDEATIYRAWQIGAHQVGMTSCDWGAQNKTDNSWDQTVQLDILPDADADWQVGVWQVDDGAIVYPEGSTTSEYLCSAVQPTHSECDANVLVDGYWAHVHTQSVGTNGGRSDETAAASMRTLIDSLTPRIAGATEPRAEWVVPTGVLQGNYCPVAALSQQALGDAESVGSARAESRRCDQVDDWRVSIQTGGAWAIPHLIGQDLSYALPNAQPATLAGTDGGAFACGDGCMGVYAVNGSAVSLYTGTADPAAFTAQAEQLIADVVAAG